MIDLLNDLADADPWYEDFSVWRYASAVRGAEPVYRICERLRPLLSWLATHTAAAPR
jgi:hypothetical protein